MPEETSAVRKTNTKVRLVSHKPQLHVGLLKDAGFLFRLDKYQWGYLGGIRHSSSIWPKCLDFLPHFPLR